MSNTETMFPKDLKASKLFEMIESAIKVAVTNHLEEFKTNKSRIEEILFSSPYAPEVGRCVTIKKVNQDRSHDDETNSSSVVSQNSDLINDNKVKEDRLLLNKVTRIRALISKYNRNPNPDDSMLLHLLRLLQPIPISMKILYHTLIGKGVCDLARKHKSSDIRNLAEDLLARWRNVVMREAYKVEEGFTLDQCHKVIKDFPEDFLETEIEASHSHQKMDALSFSEDKKDEPRVSNEDSLPMEHQTSKRKLQQGSAPVESAKKQMTTKIKEVEKIPPVKRISSRNCLRRKLRLLPRNYIGKL